MQAKEQHLRGQLLSAQARVRELEQQQAQPAETVKRQRHPKMAIQRVCNHKSQLLHSAS